MSMLDMSVLGIAIGATLLVMGKVGPSKDSEWEQALDRVREEVSYINPKPGIRTKDIDCVMKHCKYYRMSESKCKKPYSDYCGYV